MAILKTPEQLIAEAGVCPELTPVTYPVANYDGLFNTQVFKQNMAYSAAKAAAEQTAAGGSPPAAFVQSLAKLGAAIPVPPIQIVSSIVGVLTGLFDELFGRKPCDPSKVGHCPTRLNPDGRKFVSWNSMCTESGCVSARKEFCCRIDPSGMGVVLVATSVGGSDWPGKDKPWEEVPAGDLKYKDMWGAWNSDYNTLMIPGGWSVRLYRGKNLDGDSVEVNGPTIFDAGKAGWGSFKSLKIRGWWTRYDSDVAAKLKAKTAGWVTQTWPDKVTHDDIIRLVLSDPCRPPSPATFAVPIMPYQSFWRPGWEERQHLLLATQEEAKEAYVAEVAKEQAVKRTVGIGVAGAIAAAVIGGLMLRRK